MYKKKVYKIYEARKNLSSLVSDSALNPVILGKRGKPSVMIVDYDMAIKYLPKSYLEKKTNNKKSALQIYAEKQLEKMKKHPVPKHLQDNLSERVDEILYGK
jgi:hypothetical protein